MSEGFSAFKAMALGAGALVLVVTYAPDIASGHFDPMRFAKGKNKNTDTGGTGGSTSTGTTTGDSTGSTGTGTTTGGSTGSGGTTTTNGVYTEETVIPSNFDVTTTLQPSWGTGAIPVSNSPDIVGAFRFICGAGQLAYDDPIVYPGQPGKSHLHQFYGNTAANANSTFASLRASGDSTCNNMGNGTAANRSAYWMPAMLDGKGNVVQADFTQTYYKRVPDNHPTCLKYKCAGVPNGLKFIFGYDMINMKPAVYPGRFNCEKKTSTGTGTVVVTPDITAQAQYCPADGTNRLVALMGTPKCWDGKNLDTPDHRSHLADKMVKDAEGVEHCPDTHPILIPQFTLGIHYSVEGGDDLTLWHLASDEMHPELPHGMTLHADYFEAWDVNVKAMWMGNCVGKMLNCSGGDLGNSKQLKGSAQPAYGWKNPNRLVPVPRNPSTSTMASMLGMVGM